jgi:hypothetical protein
VQSDDKTSISIPLPKQLDEEKNDVMPLKKRTWTRRWKLKRDSPSPRKHMKKRYMRDKRHGERVIISSSKMNREKLYEQSVLPETVNLRVKDWNDLKHELRTKSRV